MTQTTLAVAADYADAMLVARRWKKLLVLLLLLFLLVQIAVFLTFRFYTGDNAALKAGTAFEWVINFTGFLAVICSVVLSVVLLLILGIILVGRLIGVSHLTSAFIWSVLMGAFLFPWQSVWNYPLAGTAQTAAPLVQSPEAGPSWLPGVLYTWPELLHRGHFPNNPLPAAILGWARFVGWPLVMIIVLLYVQGRSSRGLKFALGEAEIQVTDAAPNTPAGTL